jgi:hypothetical protein
MSHPFVPSDFDVPTAFAEPGFHLEPLGPEHNERDHEAWMSSIDHIKATPGFENWSWPEPMSLEANLADLVEHATDFTNRAGFTYSVLDGNDVIGCLYIYPARDDTHDAEIRSWVRADRAEMDPVVWRVVADWIAADWPFVAPRYASRD